MIHVQSRLANDCTAGNYYSFPSFEGFQEYLEDEERPEHEHDEGCHGGYSSR
jgi:hypothetical protein